MNPLTHESPEYVTRWVVTHIAPDGDSRLISVARQGRNTYATKEECQKWIDAVVSNTPHDTLVSLFGPHGLPLEPRECRCWPDHFDPAQYYFR